MSVPLIDLDEKIITDTGAVVYKHGGLVRKIQSGQSFKRLSVMRNADTERFQKIVPEILLWEPGDIEGPPEGSKDWNIPPEYLDLDWEQYVIERYSERSFGPEYEDRLVREMTLVRERRMEPFLRTIIYVVEQIKNANIPMGVGRGSACASFLLYLLGVHRIDPVKYQIPEGEFFK